MLKKLMKSLANINISDKLLKSKEVEKISIFSSERTTIVGNCLYLNWGIFGKLIITDAFLIEFLMEKFCKLIKFLLWLLLLAVLGNLGLLTPDLLKILVSI